MKLKSFKEKNKKQIGILLFTIFSVLLITGVILYKTFAIFETNDHLDLIKGSIEDSGDIEFAFYVDDQLVKDINEIPNIDSDYSLDTSSSYCMDVKNNKQISNVSWDDERKEVKLQGIHATKTKCYLYFKQIYREKILDGAIPNLGNGRLIPIQILEEEPTGITIQNMNGSYGGKVVKADITKDWYSYEQKKWANAVILKDGETDHYKPNEEIPESVIESYFVWIPRYKYQLKDNEETYNTYTTVTSKGLQNNNDNIQNLGKDNSYEIKFETKNEGLSTGTTQGQWLTHPAFTCFNSNGMWIGKFETGYLGASNTAEAQQNSQASDKIIIKPNVYSWRSIQVGNAFYASYNYLRELESHMMKNSEWGAIFYLTQSKYGLCTDGKCSEPRINNNGNYVTGYSASFEPTCGSTETNEECNKYEYINLNQDGTYGYSYYNSKSTVASTTGNYSGIYDMSGSAWKYVMGVLQTSATDANPTTGRNELYNSGFKGKYSCSTCDEKSATELTTGFEWPPSMYYDLYQYDTTNIQYQRGHLGDATKELGSFYSVQYNYGTSKPTRYVSSYFADVSYFVSSGNPWFLRGAGFTDGSEAGVGAFSGGNGSASSAASFRLVLMP